MQKIFPYVGLLLIFSCSPENSVDDTIKTIESLENNPETIAPETSEAPVLIDRNKETILTYFNALIANKQIIAGQQCGDAPDTTAWFYNTYIDQLADGTGRHAALMGADLGWFLGNNYPVNTLIEHWENGGLVTVSWHADNPFVDGVDVYWDTVNNKDKINLKALLRSAEKTPEWTNYRTELDKVAGALQELQNAGVTVIWRPFHEMNGDFFWWGADGLGNQQTNEADYKALWIDLYQTLRWEYGLDNLIWTYSVVPSNWYADVTAYYPGDAYVDLVGMDYYGEELVFPDYEALESLGKPIVMSESGPKDFAYGNWDMMKWANTLRGKAAYFLQWHSWNGAKVAIKDNKNIMELMNSDAVITRDELFANVQ